VISRPDDNHPQIIRLASSRRRDIRDTGPKAGPHSSFGQDGELIGLAFGLAYSRHRLLTSAISLVMIGTIEILQIWAPGRHARFEDFAVDALAAFVGLTAAAALEWTIQRSRRSNVSAS